MANSWTNWLRWWKLRHEFSTKYQRKPEHEKKVLSQAESNRRAWRKHKGIDRDKAKDERRSGCPKWLKRQCNKNYRAWVKSCLDNDREEEIGKKTRKDFFDPWMWD